MFERVRAVALMLLAPVLLVGCAFTPGKFTSTLTILADRSFTFTYQGEVIAVDIAGEMAKGMGDAFKDDGEDEEATEPTATFQRSMWQKNQRPKDDTDGDTAEDKAEKEAKFRAIGAALTKEAGYRSVTYKGDGVFLVDYQISGTLSHALLWPYNLDAEVIFPFIAVELRGADVVRVKAPGFGENKSSGKGMPDTGENRLDGVFTLVTDAEIVSQNNEDGARVEGNRRTISWKATPLSKDAPMAVLRLAPRP